MPTRLLYRGATYVLANDLSKRMISTPDQVEALHKQYVLHAIKELGKLAQGLSQDSDFGPALPGLQGAVKLLSNSVSVLSGQRK